MGGEVEESVFFDYGERILRLALLAQDDMINNNLLFLIVSAWSVIRGFYHSVPGFCK